MGKVVIVASTPDMEKLCAAAASISTTPGSALEIMEREWEKERAERLVSNVLKMGHATTVEHACFTLAFENVSMLVEQFMIEFRLASFTVKSRRYVDFSEMGYYSPDLAGDVMEKYRGLVERLFEEYRFFLGEGIPREDARFLLPYCLHSNFFCTVNARELRHIIQAAVWGRGSKYPEIRALGQSLWEQGKKIAPGIFKVPFKKVAEEKFRTEVKVVGGELEAEMLAFTEEPEKLVAQTFLIGRMQGIEAEVDIEELMRLVCESERPRELEQISFTWWIKNLSLAGLTHLARHRMQSLVVPSFSEMREKGFIMPDSIRQKVLLKDRYEQVCREHLKAKAELGLKDEVYLFLCGNLVDVVTTMNGRELLHFMRLRTCQRAQWEIRNLAEMMLGQLREIAPRLFKYFGPSCYLWGYCPEGKLSCGEQEKMRERYGEVNNEADCTFN